MAEKFAMVLSSLNIHGLKVFNDLSIFMSTNVGGSVPQWKSV